MQIQFTYVIYISCYRLSPGTSLFDRVGVILMAIGLLVFFSLLADRRMELKWGFRISRPKMHHG
jgi:hypothetical protein